MHFMYCPDCGGKTVPRQMGDDGAVPEAPGASGAETSFASCSRERLANSEFASRVLSASS